MSGDADTVVTFLRAFWRGDVDAAMALATPDARFVFARSLPYERHCPLRKALTQIVEGLFAAFDPPGTFDVQIRHVLVSGRHHDGRIHRRAVASRTAATTRTTT